MMSNTNLKEKIQELISKEFGSENEATTAAAKAFNKVDTGAQRYRFQYAGEDNEYSLTLDGKKGKYTWRLEQVINGRKFI